MNVQWLCHTALSILLMTSEQVRLSRAVGSVTPRWPLSPLFMVLEACQLCQKSEFCVFQLSRGNDKEWLLESQNFGANCSATVASSTTSCVMYARSQPASWCNWSTLLLQIDVGLCSLLRHRFPLSTAKVISSSSPRELCKRMRKTYDERYYYVTQNNERHVFEKASSFRKG
jgi:hypothetical protein